MTYQEHKEKARAQAIEWQAGADDRADSWQDIAEAGAYFEKIGKRYGLLTEFKQNGIL